MLSLTSTASSAIRMESLRASSRLSAKAFSAALLSLARRTESARASLARRIESARASLARRIESARASLTMRIESSLCSFRNLVCASFDLRPLTTRRYSSCSAPTKVVSGFILTAASKRRRWKSSHLCVLSVMMPRRRFISAMISSRFRFTAFSLLSASLSRFL